VLSVDGPASGFAEHAGVSTPAPSNATTPSATRAREREPEPEAVRGRRRPWSGAVKAHP